MASTRRTDGVVPYRECHLDGVASELVVRSDHGVQKDPEAIREVRRILREHVGVSMIAPGVQESAARVTATGREAGNAGDKALESAWPFAAWTTPSRDHRAA